MSRPSKPLTLSRIEDLTLGSFAFVPTSETIDHLVRYLSTWSGSDKLFMIIQYAVKLVIPLLQFRARLQYRAGTRPSAHSGAAESLTKVYNLIGDARMFFRIWGLLPIIQWLSSIERNRPPTRRLLTLERLQGWSMLAYYPLEHLYYRLQSPSPARSVSRWTSMLWGSGRAASGPFMWLCNLRTFVRIGNCSRCASATSTNLRPLLL